MFNQDQQNKIKTFSTVAKISNICFSNCINSENFIKKNNDTINTSNNSIEINNYQNNIMLNKSINNNKEYTNKLSLNEKNCIKNCSISYLELNNNIINQLTNDEVKYNEKNRTILSNKT